MRSPVSKDWTLRRKFSTCSDYFGTPTRHLLIAIQALSLQSQSRRPRSEHLPPWKRQISSQKLLWRVNNSQDTTTRNPTNQTHCYWITCSSCWSSKVKAWPPPPPRHSAPKTSSMSRWREGVAGARVSPCTPNEFISLRFPFWGITYDWLRGYQTSLLPRKTLVFPQTTQPDKSANSSAWMSLKIPLLHLLASLRWA